MNCKICGSNNPDNADKCLSCGAPLPVNNNSQQNGTVRNQNRKTDTTLVAVLLVLALVLVGLVGAYLYNTTGQRHMNSNHDEDDTMAPSLSYEQEATPLPTIAPTERPLPTLYPTPTVPAPTPLPTPTTPPYERDLVVKNEFLNKAKEIRKYSQNYLETAQTQYEMNDESYIVYQKWDSLLNEVYQYLKSTMSDAEFAALQQDEVEWIHEKENAIELAGAEWSGGSGEPLARNAAGIEYTEERCYYLISLIN